VNKPKIVIVGCGIIGAMLAYEMSRQFSADIVVLDRQTPANGSTGAALGVLMAVISGKVKGRSWRLRESSLRRYKALIAELSAQGHNVPFNSQGIVSLCFDHSKLPRWEALQMKRLDQGWPLEIWSPEELQLRCPQVNLCSDAYLNKYPNERTDETAGTVRKVQAAIYSPADAQVHPVALTHALIAAAESRGVTFYNNTEVTGLKISRQRCTAVKINQTDLAADWVVLSAGLGSGSLSKLAGRVGDLELIPVLGQAMKIQLPTGLGHQDFQPVINGDDIQFVPLGGGQYWVGATVEFPALAAGQSLDTLDQESWLREWKGGKTELAALRQGLERFVGEVTHAKVLETWRGLRPRPVGQPAPVIQPLGELENVTLATGHYRNGVLLAPATAQQICEILKEKF